VEKPGATQTARRTLGESPHRLSLTQIKPHANLSPVPIQSTQTEARRRAHTFSL
jgi:hypothetical protein